ncbi:MAG: type II 3-dehydroquinate dehydratase [Pseudomonadota bacterium]
MADNTIDKTIHVLNGPNLNLLGVREPEIYGAKTLADIEAELTAQAAPRGYAIVFGQSNHEGGLVEMIQAARQAVGIIINPAAYTHTSVAVHDALKMAEGPVIELHLSNPHAREAFRHHSYVSPLATGIVAGFGAVGYAMALGALMDRLDG